MRTQIKKIIAVVLIISVALSAFASCKSKYDVKDPVEILSYITENYKTNGLTSWWEILAVYNADENPTDYPGFNEVLSSLEGTTNSKMASYVTVANIAVIKGADKTAFSKYEEYKTNLKNLLENPTDQYTLNDYIFGYLALISSGTPFDEGKVWNYLVQSQKSDGGFALSGDSGDVDVTSFAIQAMQILYSRFQNYSHFEITPLTNALKFLEGAINENGTYSSWFDKKENANSTACALSALIGETVPGTEIVTKASNGLAIFKIKNEAGYSFLKGEKSNALSTAQAAIALGDLKNIMPVWEKLYLDSNA